MAVNILVDQIEIELPLVEAHEFEAGGAKLPGYPLPLLSLTTRKASIQQRVAVLSNPYLEAVFALDLGGRLLSLKDRRTQVEIISMPVGAKLVEGGVRGVEMQHGIEIVAGGLNRLQSLGAVHYEIEEPGEDGEPGALHLFELVPGQPLSWWATWSLDHDSAGLHLEFRMLHRGLLEDRVESSVSGLRFHAMEQAFGHESALRIPSFVPGSGLVVESIQGTFDGFWSDALLRRWVWEQELSPRQTDSWSIKLTPYSGHDGVICANSQGALSVGNVIQFQSVCVRQAAKLLAVMPDGQVLEAPVDIVPEVPMQIPLDQLPAQPSRLVLRENGADILEWTNATQNEVIGEFENGLDDASPEVLIRSSGKRAVAHLSLAVRATKAQDLPLAIHHVGESILVNGDDVLAWWHSSALKRQTAEGRLDEDVDLINAHMLCPLEPILRAESFLSTPVPEGSEPSPLLTPLKGQWDMQLEIVAILTELGMVTDAAKVVKEFLRFDSYPLLHFLYANLLLNYSKMQVEASEVVQKLGGVTSVPPYPSRESEWSAVRNLAQAFPSNQILKEYLSLLD